GLYRRSYEFICIDEAQDLNNAQYQLLKIITGSEHRNVMMVGDPNQSIFAFNGSSSDFMTKNFVEDFSPTIVELKENYRSSKAVLNAAEKIIPNASNIQNTIIDGVFEIYGASDEVDEAQWITSKIVALINTQNVEDIEGPITYEKIAVLARNKYVFASLEKYFKAECIDFYYKITPGSIRFESNVMRIFDMALRIKLNAQDILHLNRLRELLNVPKGTSLVDLLSENLITNLQQEFLEAVISLNEEGDNFKQTLEKLCESVKINSEIDDDNEKNMILNDINEILIHWHNYSKKTDNKSLTNFKNSMALGQTHPMSQPKGVTLSTVHTMKGQEYDIVFVIGLDDDTFPDYRAVKKGGMEMIQEKN
ncbi:MAG: ATP-dependent helicase, partial [Bacteroidia bacterium]|nr:ATP-dependent helicase [Bacteroidia bacterium]